jgi:predicted NUDIX family NTP pyrophosphohydrolase
MPTTSAGLLLHRRAAGGLEALLVHPGGPFWTHKDLGAWSIPKGEAEEDEELLAAALREFREETGFSPRGEMLPLGEIRQRGGKVVHAWAVRSDFDTAQLRSNTFEMEWPRGSGKMQAFPEVDRAEWFSLAEARRRILPAQAPFLDALAARLEGEAPLGG